MAQSGTKQAGIGGGHIGVVTCGPTDRRGRGRARMKWPFMPPLSILPTSFTCGTPERAALPACVYLPAAWLPRRERTREKLSPLSLWLSWIGLCQPASAGGGPTRTVFTCDCDISLFLFAPFCVIQYLPLLQAFSKLALLIR